MQVTEGDMYAVVDKLTVGPDDVIVIFVENVSQDNLGLKKFGKALSAYLPYNNKVVFLPTKTKITVMKKDENPLDIDWDNLI